MYQSVEQVFEAEFINEEIFYLLKKITLKNKGLCSLVESPSCPWGPKLLNTIGQERYHLNRIHFRKSVQKKGGIFSIIIQQ